MVAVAVMTAAATKLNDKKLHLCSFLFFERIFPAPYFYMTKGKIIVFTGPMFSRKTKSMVVELERTFWRKRNFLAFRPALDVRTERSLEKEICKALDMTMEDVKKLVFPVSTLDQVEEKIRNKKLEAVAFDETQFFDPWIVDIVRRLAWVAEVNVLISGLELDYKREGFGHMPALLAIADEVHKLTSVCSKCGERARFTQRISGTQEQVQVGGKGDYQARCADCFYDFVS